MKVELDQCDIGDLILAIEEHIQSEHERKFDINPNPFMQTITSAERECKRFEYLKKYLSNQLGE